MLGRDSQAVLRSCSFDSACCFGSVVPRPWRSFRERLHHHNPQVLTNSRLVINAAQKDDAKNTQKGAAWPVSRKDKDKQFSADQLAFLERKRRFKAGLGPAMPEASICPECNGKGTVVCWECSGAGVNHREVQDFMQGSSMEDVRQQNGVMNVQWFLMKGGPCFICRGKPECPCRACEGTGITGFDLMQYTGD